MSQGLKKGALLDHGKDAIERVPDQGGRGISPKDYSRRNRRNLIWIAIGIVAIVAIGFIFFSSKASLEFEILDKNKKTAVLKSGAGSYGKITIPSTVKLDGEEYTVTKIGAGAFLYCRGLNDITIPNSVTEIGNGAFSDCSDLTSVTIPNSVTELGNGAFYHCYGLTNVTIPNSVTEIGEWAFYDCSRLISVTIPNSVTEIGDDAFQYCDGLTNVTMPARFLDRKDEIFADCPNLKDIKTTP